MVGALLSTCMLLRTPAQDAHDHPTGPAVSIAPGAEGGATVKFSGASEKKGEGITTSDTTATKKYSDGVEEILQMVKAGISTEVIRTYIECSPVVYVLSSADIIELKKQRVPDELTTAMMKRGAALKTQVRQAIAVDSPRPAYSGGNRRFYGMDPEGYDYFQYYYLYPRTLAAANQSFYAPGPFPTGTGAYGYGPGYYAPPGFWPMRPSAFGRK